MACVATGAHGRYHQPLLEQSIVVDILRVTLLHLFTGNGGCPLHGFSLRMAPGAHLRDIERGRRRFGIPQRNYVMLSMAFLTRRGESVSGRELLAVYAPAICRSRLLMFMAGAAFYQRQTVLVRQLCVTFYAADIFGTMDRSCETAAIDFY
jgi:hypothetical protein